MKNIKVKENFTNLSEVLFEHGEISGIAEVDEYLKEYYVTMDVNGTERNITPEFRLMKGDILTVRKR
jgi:hypothetical protein